MPGVVARIRKALGFPLGGSGRGALMFWPQPSPYQTEPGWFQFGGSDPSWRGGPFACGAVYACVAVIAQEMARLELEHVRRANSGREEVTDSPITQLLRHPNPWQSRSDFILQMVHSLLLHGNAYALATRGPGGMVTSLVPLDPRGCAPYVAGDGSGQVFYSTTTDDGARVPARYILHVRVFCPDHPLIGASPIQACSAAIVQAGAIQSNSAAFFQRRSTPGGILSTPQTLTAEQVDRIAKSWNAGTTGINSGKTAVLDSDIKWQPLGIAAADAQLVEQYRMTTEDIARVFRVPLFMLGGDDLTKTTLGNTENLQRLFVISTLGFYCEHFANALTWFFGLPPRERIEFDVEAGILRGDFQARMEAGRSAITGGIMTPNEFRAREDLPPVDDGDNLFLQAQMVTVSAAAAASRADPAGTATPAETPMAKPADGPDVSVEEDGMDAATLMRATTAAILRRAASLKTAA